MLATKGGWFDGAATTHKERSALRSKGKRQDFQASKQLLLEAHTCAEPLKSISEIEALTLTPFKYKEMLILFAPHLPTRFYAVDASMNDWSNRVLTTADTICFVVDSDPDQCHSNQQALEQILWCTGHRIASVVVQYNKRDTVKAVPLADLKCFNPWNAMEVETVASEGVGVWNTLTAIHRAVRDS